MDQAKMSKYTSNKFGLFSSHWCCPTGHFSGTISFELLFDAIIMGVDVMTDSWDWLVIGRVCVFMGPGHPWSPQTQHHLWIVGGSGDASTNFKYSLWFNCVQTNCTNVKISTRKSCLDFLTLKKSCNYKGSDKRNVDQLFNCIRTII